MSNQIKNIYNSFMKQKGWYDDLVISQLPGILDKILKKDVSDLLSIKSLSQGNLVLMCNSSVWKFELIQRKNQLIIEINSELEEYKISNILII